MMSHETAAARALAALGHVARLRIFRLLVRAGPDGLNVSAVARHVALPASTLAHHISTLVAAGLVVQERRGREIINRADFAAMRGLLGYLTDNCCAGIGTVEEEDAA